MNKLVKALQITAIALVTLVLAFALFLLVGNLYKDDMQRTPWGIGTFTVVSGSMHPVINAGDIVIVRAIQPEELKLRDIVTVMSFEENDVVTHRVVDIDLENNKFTTRGETNNVDDPAASFDQLVGRVWFWLPGMGRIPELVKKPVNLVIIVFLLGFLPLNLTIISSVRSKHGKLPPSRTLNFD